MSKSRCPVKENISTEFYCMECNTRTLQDPHIDKRQKSLFVELERSLRDLPCADVANL